MRVGAVAFLAVLWVLALAANARAGSLSAPAPELDSVASAISGQDVTVRCWVDSQDPDYIDNAWAYVLLWDPVVYLSPEACTGALSLVHGEMAPLWEQAIGALSLTHEAYHLKVELPFWRRASEAQTECRAVKRVPQTLRALGASQELADAVLPWALAEH